MHLQANCDLKAAIDETLQRRVALEAIRAELAHAFFDQRAQVDTGAESPIVVSGVRRAGTWSDVRISMLKIIAWPPGRTKCHHPPPFDDAHGALSRVEGRPRRRMVACAYLPITRIENEPGIAGPWPPRPSAGGGVGAGPRSTLMVKMWLVLLSNVSVRAPIIV